MSFTRSLSNEEKAAIVSCSRATPTHLHFRLTLLPELRACASSARNFYLFGGKLLFLLSPFDEIPCVWTII